jgi:hypothetical protein
VAGRTGRDGKTSRGRVPDAAERGSESAARGGALLGYAAVEDATEPVEAGATVTEPRDDAIVVDGSGSAETPPSSTRERPVDRLRGLRPAWKALIAYVVYQLVAFWIWVVPILPSFAREHIGTGLPDSHFYQWGISWTPWAILHGLNPLHTGHVFAPAGMSLAWSAFVPGPALAAWPVTAAFGPIVSVNVVLAVAPALAAWAAYLLCHRVTNAFWASLAGGWFFGFSAYMSTNMNSWLNLVLIFPVPLLVYLVIRRVEGSIGPVAFVAGFIALLVGLFSISTELFGTAAAFGALAFGGALVFGRDMRGPLLRAGALVLLAGVIAAIVLSPYLVDILAHAPGEAVRPADRHSADLWNLVVPSQVIRAGGHALYPSLKSRTEFPLTKGQSYIGIAVLAMVILFAITEWRRRSTWLLVGFVAFMGLLTLGPVLHVAGSPGGGLPERLLASVPFMESAQPQRFAMYTSLAIAAIAALWLSRATGRWGWVRWVVAVVAIASLFPYPPEHAGPFEVPAFFSSPQAHEVLHQGEVVYAIPYEKGESMLWQATDGFWFKLAQGNIGYIPPEAGRGQIAHGLQFRGKPYPPTPEAFARWIDEHGVSAVILADAAAGKFGELMPSAGLVQVYSGGGVSVWRPAASDAELSSPASSPAPAARAAATDPA